MSNARSTRLSRRHFLLTVGAGGAATAAAVMTKTAPQPQPASPANDKRRGKGYQETAHVRSYYSTTKV